MYDPPKPDFEKLARELLRELHSLTCAFMAFAKLKNSPHITRFVEAYYTRQPPEPQLHLLVETMLIPIQSSAQHAEDAIIEYAAALGVDPDDFPKPHFPDPTRHLETFFDGIIDAPDPTWRA